MNIFISSTNFIGELHAIFLQQVYKQKVKHLLYEHQNNISELKAEGAVALNLAQDDHRGEEMELRKDKRALKVSLKEQELSHEEIIKNLKRVMFKYTLIVGYFIDKEMNLYTLNRFCCSVSIYSAKKSLLCFSFLIHTSTMKICIL